MSGWIAMAVVHADMQPSGRHKTEHENSCWKRMNGSRTRLHLPVSPPRTWDPFKSKRLGRISIGIGIGFLKPIPIPAPMPTPKPHPESQDLQSGVAGGQADRRSEISFNTYYHYVVFNANGFAIARVWAGQGQLDGRNGAQAHDRAGQGFEGGIHPLFVRLPAK